MDEPRTAPADAHHPYASLPEGKVACSRCAAVIDVHQADYAASGDMICARCAAAGDIEATEGRAVATMKGIGYTNVGIGLFAWFWNPIFAPTVMSIANAAYVSKALNNGNWYRRRLGRHYHPLKLCAIAGGLLGAAPFILPLLGML